LRQLRQLLNPPRVWDGRLAAQQALSCVYRTGQRFGAGHVIDVLLGRATERVSATPVTTALTFGIGADARTDKTRATPVFRQLVALGHLRADGEAFGALRLTQTARQVLKGETSVMLRQQAARPARAKRGKQTAAKVAIGAAAPTRPCSRRCAPGVGALPAKHGVPAFVVFHDSTLETIAALQPERAKRCAACPEWEKKTRALRGGLARGRAVAFHLRSCNDEE